MKFSEMEPNRSYSVYALVNEVTVKKTKSGGDFYLFKLTDGDEEATVRMFSFPPNIREYEKGSLILAGIETQMYEGSINYLMSSIRFTTPEDGVRIEDFILTPPEPPEVYYERCMDIIDKVGELKPELGALAREIYKIYKKKLLYWSGGKSMHHNMYGGLICHMWSCAEAAQRLLPLYPDCDEALVLAGCVLHDIGKLKELDTDEYGNAVYTTNGDLFGHLMMGSDIVRHYAAKLGTPSGMVNDLCHIIVSHHGIREYGAIALPSTIEAFLVSQIDMLDAKMFVYAKHEKNLNNGEFNERPTIDGVRVAKAWSKTK